MTKRIAVITHSRYPVEPRARRMAEACAGEGYEVDVFCLRAGAEAAWEIVDGVNVHRLPLARRQGRGRLSYMWEYLRSFVLSAWHVSRRHLKTPYALVQIYNPPDVLAFSSLLPRLLSGARILFDVRDMAPELFMSRFGLSNDHIITRTLIAHERWACRYARAITVCTKHQRDIMAARGIPADKMVVVMNTPDDRVFGLPAPLPRPPAAPDKPFTLLYHGGFLARYGLGVLIEAAPLLLGDIPTLRVECYGAGDFGPTARAMVQQLGLGEIVRFNDMVPLEAIPSVIAAADLGVVPTRQDVFTDTIMATRLMEYAHMGVPAVVSRTAATTGYFADDMVAYFKPDDPADLARQVVALYRDPARAQMLAFNARRFTEAHNWSRDKSVYVDLVNRLIGAKE